MIQTKKQKPSHGDLQPAVGIKTRKDTLKLVCFCVAPKLGSGVFYSIGGLSFCIKALRTWIVYVFHSRTKLSAHISIDAYTHVCVYIYT